MKDDEALVHRRQAVERDRYAALAREAGERIAEEDDRAIFFGDLATVPTTPESTG